MNTMTRRERLPAPQDVRRDIKNIFHALTRRTTGDGRVIPSLAEEYEWSYSASLQPSVGDRVSSGPTIAHDGSVPGATASAAAEKEAMRAKVAEAAKKIGDALNLLRSGRDDLEKAMRRLSPPEGYQPVQRFPRSASDDDLRGAREAQERRRAEGRGFGEA